MKNLKNENNQSKKLTNSNSRIRIIPPKNDIIEHVTKYEKIKFINSYRAVSVVYILFIITIIIISILYQYNHILNVNMYLVVFLIIWIAILGYIYQGSLIANISSIIMIIINLGIIFYNIPSILILLIGSIFLIEFYRSTIIEFERKKYLQDAERWLRQKTMKNI